MAPMGMGLRRASPSSCRSRRRRRRCVALGTLPAVALVAGACGDGGEVTSAEPAATEAPSTTEGTEGPLPCAQDRHAVIVDVDGTVTAGTGEYDRWITEPGYELRVKPGAPELLRAWRERGYEIVYLAGRPSTSKIGGVPIEEATSAWLAEHGIPTGEGTHLRFWDVDTTELPNYKTQELFDLTNEGVSIDYGYTDAEVDITAYRAGGLEPGDIFTRGPAMGAQGTTGVAEDSWLHHLTETVDPLPPVCER